MWFSFHFLAGIIPATEKEPGIAQWILWHAGDNILWEYRGNR